MSASRGATSNIANRYATTHIEIDVQAGDAEPEFDEFGEPVVRPAPKTRFFVDHSRSILTQNQSPDIGFEQSVNAYRGCEHGCAYCYARPTHEYLGESAGIDFESKIWVKQSAPELLRAALRKPGYVPKPISFSGVTDCYQPAERRFRLTRQCLEVLRECHHPFSIITKNHLVTRDIDLISEMAARKLAVVLISVTSLDERLAGRLEPRTSRPRMRLAAIRALRAANVPVGVMVAPVIPGLNDHEIPAILEAVAEAGATFAGMVPLRLPLTVAPVFEGWLRAEYPERAERVLNLVRAMRGGKLNDPNFGTRMRGEGAHIEQIHEMFRLFCRRFGLNQAGSRMDLDVSQFRAPAPPPRSDDDPAPDPDGGSAQLSLF